jgi:ABC-2 type transport system ATP-binding protein
VLYELTPQRASLEEAFMELTRDAVEFHGDTERPTVPSEPEGAPA